MVSRMVPIELEDGVPEAPPRRPRLGRRGRTWIVAGAIASVLALVAGQWTADRLQRSAWEALADRTDVVPPLGRSLTVRWSPDVSQTASLGQGVAWRGTVVLPVVSPDGSIGIGALDDADGHRRWTTSVIGADPQRASQGKGIRPSGSCHRVPDDPSRVVCLVTDAVVTDAGQATTTTRVRAEVHLLVVDPRTGRLQADHRIGTDLDSLSTVLPGGLAVMVSSGTARSEVVAVDATSGDQRWRTAPPALARWGGFGGAVAVGDGVAVIGSTSLDVLGADGAVRRSVTLAGYAGYVPLSDGRIAVPDGASTLVVGADRDVRLDGTPLWAASDDGSLPGLTLVRHGSLRAYDVDGRQRWELTDASPSGVVVLHGVVYLTRDGGLTAVDGTSGAVRWRVALAVQPWPAATDGRVLLVAESKDAVALDPQTGGVLWRSPLPEGHLELGASNGILFAVSRDGSGWLVVG